MSSRSNLNRLDDSVSMSQAESFQRSDLTPSSNTSEINIFALPYLQASLCATVLEDTIAALRILVECNTSLRVVKLESDMGPLIAKKYNVQQRMIQDELEGFDPEDLDKDVYKLNKLDADRRYLNDVLVDTYMDLSLNRSFRALASYVYKVIDRDKFRAGLQEIETKNRVTRRELNRQFRQQRTHIKSVMYETDAIIEDLRARVEDSTLNDAIRNRYVDSWQRSRAEQHAEVIYNREYVPASATETFKQKIDREHRVHTEVEMLINIVINETLEKVEDWMTKYEKDVEVLELKIQLKKNEYNDMCSRTKYLEETLETHDKLMNDWINFKDEREKARQYREKLAISAVIVQAWWRGIMVRQQLGPYKIKKKPKRKK